MSFTCQVCGRENGDHTRACFEDALRDLNKRHDEMRAAIQSLIDEKTVALDLRDQAEQELEKFKQSCARIDFVDGKITAESQERINDVVKRAMVKS